MIFICVHIYVYLSSDLFPLSLQSHQLVSACWPCPSGKQADQLGAGTCKVAERAHTHTHTRSDLKDQYANAVYIIAFNFSPSLNFLFALNGSLECRHYRRQTESRGKFGNWLLIQPRIQDNASSSAPCV